MLPCEVDLGMVDDNQKLMLKTKKPVQRKKLERYHQESPIKFWTNQMMFLTWEHFSSKTRQHEDMENCICMFGEKKKIQSVVSSSKYSDSGTILTMDFSNCDKLIVQYSHLTPKLGIYQLSLQNNLMGPSMLVDIAGFESDVVDIKLKNEMEKLQKKKILTNEEKERNRIHLKTSLIIETLWTHCYLSPSLEKKYVNAMKRSFTDEGSLIGELVNIKGTGCREVLRNSNNTTSVSCENHDEARRSNMTLQMKLITLDDTSVVPDRLIQNNDQHVSSCTFLSALLLIRSRNRVKSGEMEEKLEKDKNDGCFNNLPFFSKKNKEQSLHSILPEFGYVLKKMGMVSVDDLCSGKFIGLCVCAVSSYTGMSHSIGIDFDHGLIWDPAEKRAKKMNDLFFYDDLSCKKEVKLLVAALIPVIRGQGSYNKWIGKKVWIKKDREVKGDVIYVDKGVDSKGHGHMLAVIPEEGLEIVRIAANRLEVCE